MRALALTASVFALLLAACGESETANDTAATAEPLSAPAGETNTVSAAGYAYPNTRTVEHVDLYHGREVADPYRWLEQDVRESDEVREWVTAENNVTNAYLATLDQRGAIKARLTELWNYERYSIPDKAGARYFFRRNDGLQNQSVLYVQDGLDGEPRVLIDPNTWSADGATALAGVWPNKDGTKIVYSIQDGGSDWRTLRVLDVDTGELDPNGVDWVKFSGVSWAEGGYGFFYSRYPEPEEGAEFQGLNFDQKVYFHTLGEAQSEDRLVYERPDDPDHSLRGQVTDDGRYLLVTASKGTDARYELVLIDLEDWEKDPVTLVSGFEHEYSYVGNDGVEFYFRTNRDAPKGRIVAMNINHPEPDAWREIAAERDTTLRDASLVGGRIIAEYLEDAKSKVLFYSTEGGVDGELALPGIGVAGGFEGEPDDSETFYSYSSIATPPTIYRFDVDTGVNEEFKAPEVPFDPADYVVEQVFYASKDGTRIPMFIAHKDGVEPTGDRPTLLYGYGGFDIAILPSFDVSRLAWMDMGGVYAIANLRGGGEYGADWHDAGRLANKQNVFDDFAAAGEHLIDAGWTSSENLGIYGRSNGGLLVGATINQRPDLFAAALPAVGVMDMLRFNQFTAGRFWTDDYGDPTASEADFEVNLAYSPYHNIEDGQDYPAVLVTTADTDDRVVPGHSFKYIARLQAADAGEAPHLIRIETRAGHGSGKPTEKLIEEYADMWAFLAAHTGLELPEGYGG